MVCNQDATVSLTGTVKETSKNKRKGHHGFGKHKKPKSKAKTFNLSAISVAVKANVALTVKIRLPRGALKGLKHRAKASATVLLAASNANGTANAHADIASFKGVKQKKRRRH